MGSYGYGCGTFTQRADLVNAAVEKYLQAVPDRQAGGPHRRYLAGDATTARTGGTVRC